MEIKNKQRSGYNAITMKLQNILVGNTRASETNIEGRTEGPEFRDLIESIREKGVLVPVLARAMKTKTGSEYYEVIAGNRRFTAAKELGLEKIPAQVVEMTDIQAHEAQIVENLQRQDIHPLDEGRAYRELIERSDQEIGSVAVKVGKSKEYIRQRLLLTNLIEKAAEAYRKGKMFDGHAVLIARLGSNDQAKALKEVTGRWAPPILSEFKSWIKREIETTLEFQPWLKDEEARVAVGECLPGCGAKDETLFGPVRKGACTDSKCWGIKMEKWVEYKIYKAGENDAVLLKVSKEYGIVSKGVIGRSEYSSLSFKKKEQCEYAQEAIVAEGEDMGQMMMVCVDPKCAKHRPSHSEYAPTKAEKAKRKKEAVAKKKREESNIRKFMDGVDKVEFPLTKKHLDALLDFALSRCGTSYQQPAVKFIGAEVVKKQEKVYSYDNKAPEKFRMASDYEVSLRKYAESNGNSGKLRVIFALLMPHPNKYDLLDIYFKEGLKKL